MSQSDPLWHESEGTISLWMPETDTLTLAIVGKLGEEAAELAARCARTIIQGIDAIDPASGRPNREELFREVADVRAADCWACDILQPVELNDQIDARTSRKYAGFTKWHNLITDELARQGK